MSWSANFITLLTAAATGRVQLFWILAIVDLADGTTLGDAGVLAATQAIHGGAMIIGTPEIGAQSVTPQSWRAPGGAARIRVSASSHATIAEATRRGSYCRLRAGGLNWAANDYQTVFLGVIGNITATDKATLTIELWDILSALGSKPGASLMFGNAGESTHNTTDYTPGDDHIHVTSSTLFELETGGTGVLRVDVTTGSTGPFYLTFTGTTANLITGVSAAAVFGTTENIALAGTDIVVVAYMHGHPIDIFRKMLMSTGLGTNGAVDVYPASWGWAIPHADVDSTDADAVKTTVVIPLSGAHHWDVLVEDPTTASSVISWLAGLLSQAGIFPIQRQGQITVRAAQSLRPGELLLATGWTLNADDIERAESVEWWDGSAGSRYRLIACESKAGRDTYGTVGYSHGWPWQSEITYDLSEVVADNGPAIRDEVLLRLRRWCACQPESITLVLGSFLWSRLVPGDVVALTTTILRGHFASTYTGWSARSVLVTEVSSDWQGATVRVILKVLPSSDSADEWE